MITLCLCGRTASGKSTVARRLGSEWAIAESGQVVAEMLGSEPIHGLKTDAAKTEFRTRAMALVTGPQPTPLVKRLVDLLAEESRSAAIIGVRQVSTVAGLRLYAKRTVRVIYVDASIENCAQRYAVREGKAPYAYNVVAAHDVEQDQVKLKELADEVLDNNGSLEALHALVDRTIHAWSSES